MRRGWSVRAAMAGIAILLATSILLAKPGIVKTRDGQQYEGEVAEAEDVVTVTVHGVAIHIDRRNVSGITYTASIEDQYAARHERLGANEVAGRVALARWAFDNHRYDLARQVVDEAIKIEPSNREAREMIDTLDRQATLDHRTTEAREATASAGQATPSTAPAVTGVPGRNPAFRVLTEDEINIIRQKEWKLGDPQMHVQLRGDVKKRYVTASANETMAQFNLLKPYEQATKILDKKDPTLNNDIRVQNDPPSIVEYRRSIQPIITSGCATSGCHGEMVNGGFALHYPATNDASVYTNFYILQTFSKKIGGIDYHAIDRNYPDKSIVLQYLLASDQADIHHPDVPGFRSPIRSKNDANYKKVVNWAKNVLVPVPQEYGIGFDLPGTGATTQPATGPTTQPAVAPATAPTH